MCPFGSVVDCVFIHSFNINREIPSFLNSMNSMYLIKNSAALVLFEASLSSKVIFPLNSSPVNVLSFSQAKMASTRQGHLARAVCKPTSSIPSEGKEKVALKCLNVP